jgi:gluconate 2-dehydrogenase gamma chain
MQDRRELLRLIAVGAAWPFASSLIPADLLAFGEHVHASVKADDPTLRVLGARTALVTAACERIIPADDTPGATAAGVPAFIDRMLADWYDPGETSRFLDGLDVLDARSRKAHGRGFATADQSEQLALLVWFDAEAQSIGPESRRSHWFGMLKYLTIWGYCTSEVGARQELRTYPQPLKYDGNAPYTRRTGL